MDEHTIGQPEPPVYEQLYLSLYAYHFGAIGFLELLEQFEAALHIKRSDEIEMVNVNVTLD
jgi:hypothetical protein